MKFIKRYIIWEKFSKFENKNPKLYSISSKDLLGDQVVIVAKIEKGVKYEKVY